MISTSYISNCSPIFSVSGFSQFTSLLSDYNNYRVAQNKMPHQLFECYQKKFPGETGVTKKNTLWKIVIFIVIVLHGSAAM